MTTLSIIWAVLVVPAFAVFAHYSIQWAYEDLNEVTNNDKLGMYALSGLLAIGWPIVAAAMIGIGVNNYINGRHGS